MYRVKMACQTCKKCNSSTIAHASRNQARFWMALCTVGLSEMVLAFRKKCRQCGHQSSLHARQAAVMS